MSLLGLDIGTTGCKVGVFNVDGVLLATEYCEYETEYYENGHAELNSMKVWNSIQTLIRTMAEKTTRDPITALSVSSLGEAVTPISKERKILGNAILSSDTRGEKYVQRLREKMSEAQFYAINGNLLSVHYSMPKICWIKEHAPNVYDETDKFLLWDGLVGTLLGCDPFVSYSSASRTLLFDRNRTTWSDELCNVCGIDKSKLPACLESGTVAGEVREDIADALGLIRNVKIVVGGHDQCCAALGSGVIHGGRAMVGMGTYECLTPVYTQVPNLESMRKGGLNIEHHVIPGAYVSFIYNQSGSLVKWFRDTFAKECKEEKNIYDRLNLEMPDAPTSLLVLPYFQPTGAPSYINDGTGVIAGLKISTTRGEILKAIMESVTYYFSESLESLKGFGNGVESFVATGGGANSDRWLQMKADIWNIPLTRTKIKDCGLVGAAMLAGKATGVFASIEEASRSWVKDERTFEPNPETNRHYQQNLGKYRTLFNTFYPLMKQFA